MTPYSRSETLVGAFVVLGVLALAYLSVNLAGVHPFQSSGTLLNARFSSAGTLKKGDPVRIAGVTVGAVESIRLVDFEAEAELRITAPVALPEDSIASIQNSGLLGDSFVSVSPGASDKDLANGARIARTETAASLSSLIAKYAFGSPVGDDTKQDEQAAAKPTSPFADPLAENAAPSSIPTGSAAAAPSSNPKASGAPNATPPADSLPPKPSAQPKKPSPFKDPLELD